jgi:hypothetical protein
VRYYKLRITRPADGYLAVPNANGQPGFSWVVDDGVSATYTSLNSGASVSQLGSTNMSALAVELDCIGGPMHSPSGDANSYIKIHGVGLGEIAAAADLNFMNAALYVGMAAGLPLANPNQTGLAVAGQVLSCLGNWVDGDQWLAIFIQAGGSSPSSNQTTGHPANFNSTPLPAVNYTPANLVLSWLPGQPLLQALTNTLTVAFPKYTVRGAVNVGLVRSGTPAVGYFNTLQQLAIYTHQMSLSLLQGSAPAPFAQAYSGVLMSLSGNTINIQDGTVPTTPKQINFLDLVGQPSWVGPYTVQVTCAMRGDIQSGDYVQLPPLLGTISAGSGAQFNAISAGSGGGGGLYGQLKNSSAFTGTFLVTDIHFVGASRQPEAESWITTLNCLSTPSTGAAAASTVDQLPILAAPNTSWTFTLPN